jgi:hypothetical protein
MDNFLKESPIETGPFQPTWESLRECQCPAWFQDAKLGIWSHWGPQSVPMYGDWYARNMYWLAATVLVPSSVVARRGRGSRRRAQR